MAERREAIARKWAARHPDRAEAERRLRKRQKALDRATDPYSDGGTPETRDKASRVRQGALARLCQSGAISADQLAWAGEIAAVHERIAADVSLRCISLETRVDISRSHDGAFFEKLGAVRAEVAYTQWRAGLKRPGPVLAMLVEDCGVNAAARAFHMDKRTAKRLLIDALEAWPNACRDAWRQVDDATLAAAQSGIL